MWWFGKKEPKKIEISHKHYNAYWLIDRELERLHKLMAAEMVAGGSIKNANLFKGRIDDLLKYIPILVDKAADPEVLKRVRNIEEEQIENIMLIDK